jgi:hypothetical protein
MCSPAEDQAGSSPYTLLVAPLDQRSAETAPSRPIGVHHGQVRCIAGVVGISDPLPFGGNQARKNSSSGVRAKRRCLEPSASMT